MSDYYEYYVPNDDYDHYEPGDLSDVGARAYIYQLLYQRAVRVAATSYITEKDEQWLNQIGITSKTPKTTPGTVPTPPPEPPTTTPDNQPPPTNWPPL